MIDIRINVSIPDLVTAAGLLAGTRHSIPAQEAPVKPQEAPKPQEVPVPVPTPQTPPPAPVTPQTPSPANVVPMTPPPAQAPTAGPSYTVEDLSRAGAELLRDNPTVHPQLMGLLAQFGVKATTQLRSEQLAPFANALRQLGAKL